MVVTGSAEQVAEQGETIYRDHVRSKLTEGDKGKFIIINTVTGEWVADSDLEVAENKARSRFTKGQPRYTIRAGYKAAFSLRPGINLELAEW